MTEFFPWYEEYRIDFVDGSKTIITILEDDLVQDTVVDECEMNGWNVDDVIRITLIKIVERDEFGNRQTINKE